MTKTEFDEWVSAYIEAQDSSENITEQHPLFWAIKKFFELNEEDPELCWKAILEILKRNPSDKVRDILAGGALEDLIEYHGPEFIDRIEKEAIKNSSFKHLLAGVWESSNLVIWARVKKARGES